MIGGYGGNHSSNNVHGLLFSMELGIPPDADRHNKRGSNGNNVASHKAEFVVLSDCKSWYSDIRECAYAPATANVNLLLLMLMGWDLHQIYIDNIIVPLGGGTIL